MRRVGSYQATTHLPRLLEAVAGGETIEITKHGVPVAVLSPVGGRTPDDREAVLDELLEFRRQHPLDGVTTRELIDDGRR